MISHNAHVGTIRPSDSMMYAIEMLWHPGIIGDNFRRGLKADWDRYARPGAVIDMMKRMSPTWAAPLQDLTSEDFERMRFDVYYADEAWGRKKQVSNMLMEFDKKFKR